MCKRTTCLKTIVLSVVVTVSAGCGWENPLYNNFVDGDNVTFCPPVDAHGNRDKATFDYFYFGQIEKSCTSQDYKDCLEEVLPLIKGKDPGLYKHIKDLNYSKAFEVGICPVGFVCLQTSDTKNWYCKTKETCKSEEISCEGICLNKNEFHVLSCKEANIIEDNDSRLECAPGYIDCDGKVYNGCEVSASDTQIASCTNNNNIIRISSCQDGYVDCDGLVGNGCEISTSLTHITGCVHDNDSIEILCEPGFVDCDGIVSNGCEVVGQISHIKSCKYNDVSAAITGCDYGYADCNGLFEDGCEVNTLLSNEHCGADSLCEGGEVCEGVYVCDNGKCVDDCSMDICDDGETQVCVDLQNSDHHCGTCGKDCTVGMPLNSSFLGCYDGNCRYECSSGYRWFDLNDGNGGFECIDLNRDDNHCGHYDNKCRDNEMCEDGECVVQECSSNRELLCEVDHRKECINVRGNDVNHCGECNYVCQEHLPDANTVVSRCNDGDCEYECKEGYINCPVDDVLFNCVNEAGMLSDNNNCGSCNNTCKDGYSCISGVCQLTSCTDGSNLCVNGDDRYCAYLDNDVKNCGGCGYKCSEHSLVNASSSSCTAGACVYKCSSGFTNCGGVNASDIKCINVKSNDVNNCGSCGKKCASTAGTNGTLSGCASGTCKYICKSGFTKCSGTDAAPKCYNLTNDRYHCGTCSKSCPAKAGTNGTFDKCSASACRYKCVSGYTKCSGNDLAPVCYNLKTDVNHCGSCSKKCTKPANASSVSCNAGACKITCKSGYKLKNGKCVK